MFKLNPEDYLSIDEYEEALGVLHVIACSLLFEFARENTGLRDTIVRNFVARADTLARAVFRLWEMQDYNDCWVLNRCLYDRLFHLWYLGQHGGFEAFEEWSFWKQYTALESVRSEPEAAAVRNSPLLRVTPEQKARAKKLSKNQPRWSRPKPEDCAKGLHLPFLYRYGYDFTSTHVHPMADDGLQDFYAITGLQPTPVFPDQRSVLSNTLLTTTMLLQEAMNVSTLSWRALVFCCLEDVTQFLACGDDHFRMAFLKLGKLIEQEDRLSRPAGGAEDAGAQSCE